MLLLLPLLPLLPLLIQLVEHVLVLASFTHDVVKQ